MLIKRRTFEKYIYKHYGESAYKKKNHFKKVLIKIMEKVLIKIMEKVLVNKKHSKCAYKFSYYKLGQRGITNWGSFFYYKLGQTRITNWGSFFITN